MARGVRRTHNLKRAAGRLEQGVKLGLVRGLMLTKKRAQERAPEDTGRMLRGLIITPPRWRRGHLSARLGSKVEYARYTELPRYIMNKRLGPVSEAKGATMPWLGPALRETKDEIAAVMGATIRSTLRAIARSS